MWDFVANATVDSLDVVPEQFKGLYAEKDGKFTISDVAKGIVEAYTGQTTALNKARKDLKTANDESASRRVTKQAVLDYAKTLGLENVNDENPLESLDTYVKELVTKGKGGADLKVNMDNIKRDSERRIQEIQTASDAKVLKMQSTLEKFLISKEATAALAKHNGNIDLLLDKVVGRAKVVQDGDDYVVRIVDENGEARSDGAGGWMSIDGYVQEMKTKPTFGVAFKSEANGGNGHKPNSQNQQFKQRDNSQMSSVDKIAAGIAKNQHERGREAAEA